jgi:hypothetical protein
VRGRRGRDHPDDGRRAPHATAGGCDHDGKTADRHVQNAYAKLGVSTRAAATLLAIEHGLLAWRELPIVPT